MRIRYLSERRTPLAVVEWHPAMLYAHQVVDNVFRAYTGSEATLTGAQEDAHSDGSKHFGTSDDFRCRAGDYADDPVKPEQRPEIEAELQRRLGANFDIVWERYHLHVEFDPEPYT